MLDQRAVRPATPGWRFIRCRGQNNDFEESGLPPPPDVIVELKVEKGDTLKGLAQMYHLPYEKLLAANKGKSKVKAGHKLRFSVPLPKDEEALHRLLTPTKDLVKEALAERAAETGQHTIGAWPEGQQKGAFQGVEPAGNEHTYMTTAKYLGGAAGKVLLFGAVAFVLVRLGMKLTGLDRSAAAKSGAAWPAMDDADLTTRFQLKNPQGKAPDAPLQGNRGGVASTSTQAPARATAEKLEAAGSPPDGATAQNGASTSNEAASKTGDGGWLSEDPEWLALSAVHYAMLPGNQQPCFRVALDHTDTRAWLAWQDPDDLRRLLRCMEVNGLVPEPAAVRLVASPPYEYLQTAEHNGRPVGFVPKGTLIEEAWHDEQLMDALVEAAQVVPRQPPGVPSSAQSILTRWRRRCGLSVDTKDVLGSGAWEVRSIDEEEEAGYDKSADGGRVIEAFTEPLQDADSSSTERPPQRTQQADDTTNSNSSSNSNQNREEAEEGGGKQADDRTVWQRLRGVKRGTGAKSGDGRAGQGAHRGGRLSAGRILERSTSKKGGTGAPDPFAEMLGLGSGNRDSPLQRQDMHQRERPPPAAPAVPEQDQQKQQAPSSGSHQNGAARGGAGQAMGSADVSSADVSGSAGDSADADARARQYADILSKQRDVAGSHSHLDKVRRDSLPVDLKDNEGDDKGVTSPGDLPAASQGPTADWTQAARRGQRLADLAADAAAAQHRNQPPKQSSTGDSGTGSSTEWLALAVVCVPVRQFRDGGYGFLTADPAAAAEGGDAPAARPAIVGFADRADAQQVQWLWESWPQAEDGANRVLPLPPAKLQAVAQEQGFEVVVFPKRQLPLRPGMSEQQLGALFSAYASLQ